MRSDGQARAVAQLEDIAAASGGDLELVAITEPSVEGGTLTVLLSLWCQAFPRHADGIPLRPRERVSVSVPWTFPIGIPSASFTHSRYAKFPHVQWGSSICLYQASDVEWHYADGMFGFMQRLVDWLRAGALGELDPTGAPLHPPVAYSSTRFRIVPCVDAPAVDGAYWIGHAQVQRDTDAAAELGAWIRHGEPPPEGRLATAVLLSSTMPHEYPSTMRDLLFQLKARGVPMELMRLLMTLGVLRTDEGQPALFVLGAPMRGVQGEERKQHLACWMVSPEDTARLRAAAMEATDENPVDVETFIEWAVEANVEWCPVLENRPEIVTRRDAASPGAWWHGKNVAILGCGAIGSAMAMILARAGVRRLELHDKNVVSPGVLVRQNFKRKDVGFTKCSALAVAIKEASPDVDAEPIHRDLLFLLRDADAVQKLLTADVIIDATASGLVAAGLEAMLKDRNEHPPVLSMVMGHRADRGMATMYAAASGGGAIHHDRRCKLALADHGNSRAFLDEFYPDAGMRRPIFQPEPGCSSPTFVGSYADTMGLTSRMANVGAAWLTKERRPPCAYLLHAPAAENLTDLRLNWSESRSVPDSRHGYHVRIDPSALAGIAGWIRRSDRVNGRRFETGGVLFGEVDEELKIIWVDEISGPPPDSLASPAGFICGVEGVSALNDEKKRRTRGSVAFVGMWHTHPVSLPLPSDTDQSAMDALLTDGSFLGRQFLMLIIGQTAGRFPIAAAHVYERSEYAK